VGRVVVVVVVVKVVVVTVRRGRRTQRPRGYRVWDNRYRSCVILGVECHVCGVAEGSCRFRCATRLQPGVCILGFITCALVCGPLRLASAGESREIVSPDQPPTRPRIPYSGFFSCDHLIPAHLHAVVLSSAKADSLRSLHKRRPGFHAMVHGPHAACGLGTSSGLS
jgi:hypothetical protein